MIRTKVLGVPLEASVGRFRRLFGSSRAVYGRLEFRKDGLFLCPYRIEQLLTGVRPRYLAMWDEVLAVDVDDSFGGSAGLILLRRDRSRQFVSGVKQALCEKALRDIAFEPHERASWPGHRLFTRPPADPDWSLLND
jgi:hypothetical protein